MDGSHGGDGCAAANASVDVLPRQGQRFLPRATVASKMQSLTFEPPAVNRNSTHNKDE